MHANPVEQDVALRPASGHPACGDAGSSPRAPDSRSAAQPASGVSGSFIGRFQLLERIGSGAGAVVHRARDTRFGQEVAIKMFSAGDRGTRGQLRRDFRVVSELCAPELPRMYELFELDGHAVVVMELFRGEDVERSLDGGRLSVRAVARGLLRGLAALHERGLVHGDVKPANLLIREDGQVVLADLGLARRADRHREGVSGTLAYFAPELTRVGEATAASDLYAAGLTLFEVATGHGLSPRQRRAIYTAALVGSRPSPPPAADATVAQVIVDLLDPDPGRRPAAREACRRLGLTTAADDSWIGRAEELERLQHWWEGPVGVAVLRGESGVGKTALVDRFAARLRRDGVVVLRSRCHANARVPFHAFESVVDDLGSELARLADDIRRPIETTFPFLSGPADDGRDSAEGAPLPGELAHAVRALLQAVDRPVCWVIDDAQWLDPDSERVLLGLTSMCARLLVVGRADASTLLDRLELDAEVLQLSPLDLDDSISWLARHSPGDPPAELRRKALCARGSPLLLGLLSSAGHGCGIEEAWRARFARLSPEARSILELLAVAGVPMRVPDLLNAIADEPNWAALRELEDRGLILWVLEGELRRVFFSHLGIVEALGAVDRRAALALARRLEELAAEPLLLATVYRNAGADDRAAPFAWMAIEDALGRGAFAAALHWCDYLLEHPAGPAPRARLLQAAARAHAGLGQVAEAAQVLEAACAHLPPGIESGRSRAEAALLWLGAGHARPGLEQLRLASRELGMPLPSSRVRAWGRSLVDGMWLAAHGVELSAQPTTDPRRSAQLEAAKAASGPLWFLEYSTAAATVLRYLRLSLAAGDVDHACRAAALTWNALAQSGKPGRQREALRSFLDRHTPAASRDVQAFVEATRAYVAIYCDRMGSSLELLDYALTLYDPRRRDFWDQPFTRVQRLIARHFTEPCSLAWATEVDRLRETLAAAGNLLSSAMVDLGVGYAADLSRDDPRSAEERVARAESMFDEVPAAYAWLATFARARIALFEDDLEGAARALRTRPPRDLRGVQHVRASYRWLEGLLAVRLATEGDSRGLARARRASDRIAREPGFWGVGHADALRAAIAGCEGQAATAASHRRRAFEAYRAANLLAFADLATRASDATPGWHRLFWPLIVVEDA